MSELFLYIHLYPNQRPHIGLSKICVFLADIHESPILEDDDDEFDPVLPSITTTITTATSEQSTESCDTSPDVVSPTVSRCSEDLSQEPPDTPTSDVLETAVLRDEGPDSVPAE